jgi:lysophospholipase L1-like esterase
MNRPALLRQLLSTKRWSDETEDTGMILEPGSRLVMIGDSITDAERARPIGEGLFAGVGLGYVSYVDALLTVRYPDRRIRVTNMGISGNTVRDLKARWKTDVLDLRPDWLSIMIGTNDVWRQFDVPLLVEQQVGPDEYEATLDDLVSQTRPAVRGLILVSPFYIEPNQADAMRARMDEYGAIVRRIAAKHSALFVDVQSAMDSVLAHLYPATLAWDRVHPNHAGAMVIARAFLNAVGFEWDGAEGPA